jgi:hypothetical protein
MVLSRLYSIIALGRLENTGGYVLFCCWQVPSRLRPITPLLAGR